MRNNNRHDESGFRTNDYLFVFVTNDAMLLMINHRNIKLVINKRNMCLTTINNRMRIIIKWNRRNSGVKSIHIVGGLAGHSQLFPKLIDMT